MQGSLDARGRTEALALAALAAVPFLAYFAYLASHPVERFATSGDFAHLELDVRLVGHGTLLGAYSRFQFSHPGPLWFYLAAPVYALVGGTSTGLFAAAVAINALTAAAIVGSVRALVSRAHAVAALLVVLAFLGAFGDVCALPWNPLTVTLPLLAFLVHAALFARGGAPSAPIAAFFGALAAQTHVATAPTVLAIGVAAGASFAYGVRAEKRPLARRERAYLAAAAALGLVLFAPAIYEQLVARDGNLAKLVRFFRHRPEPVKPLATALEGWSFAATWLPDRLFSFALAHDGSEPMPMGSRPVPAELSGHAMRVLFVTIAAFIAAAFVALRRRDRSSLAFVLTGVAASLAAIVSLTRVVGPNLHYLFFWTTAGTTLAWIGVASTIAGALFDRFALGRGATVGRRLTLVAVVAATLGSFALQRAWLAKDALAPKPDARYRAAYTTLRDRLRRERRAPVVHMEGAWNYGLGLLLELSKDGLAPRVTERDRWLAGRQFAGPDGATAPMHLWTSSGESPLLLARCLELVAEARDLRIFAAPSDVRACED